MDNPFWTLLAWVIAASVLGFAISAGFAGRLKFSRTWFLIPYVCLVGIFLYGFVTLNNIDLTAIMNSNWAWGILAGLLASIILVINVHSQPDSRQFHGAGLVFDISWAGLVYGCLDALFLNVMPVVAVWSGMAPFGWTSTVMGKILVGAIGLLASLLITLTYHLGYPEFRNKKVILVLVGNLIITLAFLLSGNPLGSLLSHAIMHIAAVIQGPETTIQLPPHYQAI